jgi:hypothetical protein
MDARRLANAQEAMDLFGVPMFVLDGELFWGGDRIDRLIERLSKRRAGQEPMAASSKASTRICLGGRVRTILPSGVVFNVRR